MKKLVLLNSLSLAVIVVFTFNACKQAATEVVKEGVETLSEKGILTVAKTGAKEAAEGAVASGARMTTKKNLIHSARLASVRVAVKGRNQFITHDKFVLWLKNTENKKRLLLNHPKDGRILAENMRMVMGKDFDKFAHFKSYEAHHLVGASKHPSAMKSQKILEKYMVNINDPMNGLILPRDKFSVYMGQIHRGGHTIQYHNLVLERLSKAKTRKQCFAVLDQIKTEIYTGKIPLYKNHQINSVTSAFKN